MGSKGGLKGVTGVDLSGRNGAFGGAASGDLRAQVAAALEDLSELEARNRGGLSVPPKPDAKDRGRGRAGEVPVKGFGGRLGTDGGGGKTEQQGKRIHHGEKGDIIQISRSIVKKLYRKNVELEKEVQLLRLQISNGVGNPPTLKQPPPFPPIVEERSNVKTLLSTLPQDSLASAALQERDRTIAELRMVAGMQQQRIEMLERTGAHRRGPAAPSAAEGLRQALAESQAHLEGYQKIRADYQRLLSRRIDALKKRGAASKEAKALIAEMNLRLSREMVERDTETALYNAKLYHTEQKTADWYVEKRLMDQRIEKLEAELAERDRLDAQIETCVCTIFERMKLLEQTNRDLSSRLVSLRLSESQRDETERPLTGESQDSSVRKSHDDGDTDALFMQSLDSGHSH